MCVCSNKMVIKNNLPPYFRPRLIFNPPGASTIATERTALLLSKSCMDATFSQPDVNKGGLRDGGFPLVAETATE